MSAGEGVRPSGARREAMNSARRDLIFEVASRAAAPLRSVVALAAEGEVLLFLSVAVVAIRT